MKNFLKRKTHCCKRLQQWVFVSHDSSTPRKSPGVPSGPLSRRCPSSTSTKRSHRRLPPIACTARTYPHGRLPPRFFATASTPACCSRASHFIGSTYSTRVSFMDVVMKIFGKIGSSFVIFTIWRILVWRVRLHIRVHIRVVQRIAPLVPFGDGQRQRRIKDRGQRVHERHIRLHARIAFRSHVGDRPHQ